MKWTLSILSTSSPTGSTWRISSTRGFLEYFISVIRLPQQLHHHFRRRHGSAWGASSTTSSLTCVRLKGLPRPPQQHQHRLGRHRFPTSSSTSTARRWQDAGSWGFVVYLINIDFQLRLWRLLHRRWLGYGSRGFIVYLTDVDSSFVFINMYFVARDARD
jgi:hypothetical protein